jgi:glycosyltransferase involved in cell wall biosynthesis
MKVYIISAVYLPEPVTSALTSADLAEELVHRGHQVIVFTQFPNRPSGRVAHGFKRRWKMVEERAGYVVVHCWHTLSKKSIFLSRTAENISFAITSSFQLLKHKKPDIVYMVTWPIFSQSLNSWLLKKRGVPIVCSVQDIYPESLTGKEAIKPNGWLAKILRYIDIRHLRRCSIITSISANMIELLVKDRGLPPEKTKLIPNWLDGKSFLPELPRVGKFRHKLGFGPEIFLAIFAGSITKAAGLDLYVKAAEKLSSKNHIRILLVGDGSMREELQKEISARNLSNIQVIFPLRFEEVPEVHAAADILLISLSGEMDQTAVPSKLLAYMFSGRPTLASISSGNTAAKILIEADAGFVIPPDDPQAVADKLIFLEKNQVILSGLAANAKRYAENNFSKQVILPQLVDILEGELQPKVQ